MTMVRQSATLFCALVLACSNSNGGGNDGGENSDGSAPLGEGGVDSGADSSPDVMPKYATVTCEVLDSSTHLVVPGLPVAILDAVSNKQQVLSDGNGKATFANVVMPYDVLVSPADPQSTSYIYIGVDVADVRVNATSVANTMGYKADLTMPIQMPPCGGGCPVTVWTKSKDMGSGGEGSGGYSSFGNGLSTLAVPFDHQWLGPTTSVTMYWHVLVSDPAFSTFWHVSGNSIVSPGSNNLGTVAPQAVPTAGTISATQSWVSQPPQWDTSMQVFLSYANGEGLAYLSRSSSNSVSSGLPSIPGATVSVGGYGRPINNQIYDGVNASTPDLPLSSTSASLTLTHPPDLTNPIVGGHIAKGGVVQWQDYGAPATYSIGLYDAGAKRQLGWVTTLNKALDLSRLAALGVKVDPDPYNLTIGARRPAIAMKDVLSTSNKNGPSMLRFLEGSSTVKDIVVDP